MKNKIIAYFTHPIVITINLNSFVISSLPLLHRKTITHIASIMSKTKNMHIKGLTPNVINHLPRTHICFILYILSRSTKCYVDMVHTISAARSIDSMHVQPLRSNFHVKTSRNRAASREQHFRRAELIAD